MFQSREEISSAKVGYILSYLFLAFFLSSHSGIASLPAATYLYTGN
jgi:hypothetical protein